MKGWAGQVTRIGEIRNAYTIFGTKLEGNRYSGRCEDDIKMNIAQIGHGLDSSSLG
jgi:hypothetical protein